MNKTFFKTGLSFVSILPVVVAGLLLAAGPPAYAQQTKKVGQLNFQVPEDWPVVQRGGLTVPVPTEEYVSMKFKEIEKEFQTIKDTFSEKLSGLESSLKSLEEGLTKKINALQSQEEAAKGSGGGMAEVLSSLESIKGELLRLDRKITNKIQEVQGQIELISPQVESAEKHNEELQTQIYRLDEKIDYLQEGQPSSY